MGTLVNNNNDWEELPSDDNLYKGGHLQNHIFYNYSLSSQRLADDIVRIFYTEKLPDDFHEVLLHLKASFEFKKI